MKKIFYILASAIVALGAVACENEGMENITPEVNGDTVSFVANIDNTKTDLDGLQTVWTAGDVITVVWNGTEYPFTNSEGALNVFSHTAEGLSKIEGQTVEAWYNKAGVDSSKGTAGAQLYATGSFGETLQFQIQSAFLKFTTTGGVKITATEGLFSEGTELTFNKAGEHYIAINPVKATITATANRLNKTKEIDFAVKQIYNLGELSPVYRVYVTAQPKSSPAEWTKVNVYSWVEGGANNATWPGEDVTANEETINDYAYNYYEYPATFNGLDVSVIVNNGADQTGDINLGTLNNDYYVVYGNTMEKVYTTAPAAGSIEEYVAPVVVEKLYLNPKAWDPSSAWFAAYFYGNGTKWVKMTDDDKDGIYECDKMPEGKKYPNVIFCRMNPSKTALDWSSKWNQTGDLTIPTDGKNLFTINTSSGWDGQTTGWSTKQ